MYGYERLRCLPFCLIRILLDEIVSTGFDLECRYCGMYGKVLSTNESESESDER